MFEIPYFWLVPLIFVPFVLGLLTGIHTMQRKMTMKLLKVLDIEQFEKLMEE